MIKLNLTTEEARKTGSWAKIIIKGLQEKLENMPMIKKKAEIIIMEHQQRMKKTDGKFIDFLTSFVEGCETSKSAEKFIKDYDEEIRKVNADINCWVVIEEQIKNQIINETTEKENKNRKNESSDPLS